MSDFGVDILTLHIFLRRERSYQESELERCHVETALFPYMTKIGPHTWLPNQLGKSRITISHFAVQTPRKSGFPSTYHVAHWNLSANPDHGIYSMGYLDRELIYPLRCVRPQRDVAQSCPHFQNLRMLAGTSGRGPPKTRQPLVCRGTAATSPLLPYGRNNMVTKGDRIRQSSWHCEEILKQSGQGLVPPPQNHDDGLTWLIASI